MFTFVQKESEWASCLVYFAMAAITSVETNTLAVPARGVPLYPDAIVISTHSSCHAGLRAQIWQTTWKEERQRKHGYFHSFEMLNTQNPLQQKGQFCRSLFSNTHGEDIEELCSALMHWLWSYAMCLLGQWRETDADKQHVELEATLETFHTLFLDHFVQYLFA